MPRYEKLLCWGNWANEERSKKRFALTRSRCSGGYRSVLCQACGPIEPDALINNIEFNNSIFRWISNHTYRIAAVLNVFNLLFKKFAQYYNTFILNSEPLLSAISQGALGFPGHRVLR